MGKAYHYTLALCKVVLLIGCGGGPEPVPETNKVRYVSPSLEPSVREFESACSAYQASCNMADLVIVVDVIPDRPDNVRAHCYQDERVIRITDRIVDSPKLRGVVFHELGHCALGKEHDPVGSFSIMAPSGPRAVTDPADWEFLVADLMQ